MDSNHLGKISDPFTKKFIYKNVNYLKLYKNKRHWKP